uniref:Retrovirus-related Pol polyprotein from transposon TNT 1-94 n=1 Tax=Tanacetum cinerariifolium TaxID=118510 RepID=A0A6L2P1C0_TANCI|nr:retrovirus-related Pol polyprotein from transposon TNT 1-94 [Tanacetum cinerariifolium]
MEEEDKEIIKSINETPAEKAAKRRKLHEEDEDLKKQLEVVDDEDDDVFIEATPIGRKLKNFDREDLEDLWRIVKARFSTSKPTYFSDDYLLSTLKTMFEKTDGQDAIWRNQQSLTLSKFTLERLVNVVRLKVEEESEMSLELLRFTRQQLQEYQQGIFLAYAAYVGFMVYQMDVKSAFLNRKLSKEVYVQQLPGFESNEFPNYVCKLDKALCRLKQTLRA